MSDEKVPDFSGKDDEKIEQWMRNHETAGATLTPLYKALAEEAAKRSESKGLLEIGKSLGALTEAAEKQLYITYGDLARASGVPWSKARHRMNGAKGHLDRLIDVCHARGLPLLPAICVNESGRKTGKLEPDALIGFASAARRIGHLFSDDQLFHQKCCKECFAWGLASRTGAS